MNFNDVIPPELLYSELVGEVKPTDYLATSSQILQSYHPNMDNLEQTDPTLAIDIEDAYLLAERGYLPLENGYVRCQDGSIYVAVFTDLGSVTGQMFDWWFCQCDNTEKYKWWHPKDHITGIWDDTYYASMPMERLPGHYINHIHIVNELIGSNQQSLQIEFLRPSKYFDIHKFSDLNITACIVGRIYSNDPHFGLLGIGYLIHIVREIDGRNELRSRFWLGKDIYYPETQENILFASLINYITSFKMIKMSKIPMSLAKGLYQHCSEEMNCLTHFLPTYYEQTKQQWKEFQENFSFN